MKLPMKKDTGKGEHKNMNRRQSDNDAFGRSKPRSDSGFKKNTHQDYHHDLRTRENARISKGLAKGKAKMTSMKANVANTKLPYQKAMAQKEMDSDNVKVANAMKGAKLYLNGK